MVMRKGIEKAVDAAVEAIKANSDARVNGSADIARVGTVSSGDETIGKLIAEAMEKVGNERRHHHRGEQDRRDRSGRGRGYAV